MREIYEKMREHLDRYELSRRSLGLSTREVVAQDYADAQFEQLVGDLRRIPPSGDATFRLWSFIYERRQERIPLQLRREAADQLAAYLAAPGQSVDSEALQIFAAWGTHRPDYRSVCEPFLRHPAPHIRMTALSYAGLFLPPRAFNLLFEFRHDPFAAETGGMGGPLRYILRDHALHVLETLTHCPVLAADDCFEDTPDGRVSFRSWSFFLNWYERNKKRFK